MSHSRKKINSSYFSCNLTETLLLEFHEYWMLDFYSWTWILTNEQEGSKCIFHVYKRRLLRQGSRKVLSHRCSQHTITYTHTHTHTRAHTHTYVHTQSERFHFITSSDTVRNFKRFCAKNPRNHKKISEIIVTTIAMCVAVWLCVSDAS